MSTATVTLDLPDVLYHRLKGVALVTNIGRMDHARRSGNGWDLRVLPSASPRPALALHRAPSASSACSLERPSRSTEAASPTAAAIGPVLGTALPSATAQVHGMASQRSSGARSSSGPSLARTAAR